MKNPIKRLIYSIAQKSSFSEDLPEMPFLFHKAEAKSEQEGKQRVNHQSNIAHSIMMLNMG